MPSRAVKRMRANAVAAGALSLGACRRAGILAPEGPISGAERLILLNATAIMLVVVLPVIVLTLAFAWRYRASNARAAYRPNWTYSGRIELVVWAIPAMVVILLSGVAWIGSHELDPAARLLSPVEPMRIEVVSLDWKWLFIYPELKIAAVNRLVVPTGTPLAFSLTSATVMSAFFVPQLGTQIYTMPGMTTRLNLLADRPGDYPGLSSHFNGDGFSDMRFEVHVVSAAEFERWAVNTGNSPQRLDTHAFNELARPGSRDDRPVYGSVEAGLFSRIISMSAPLAEGSSVALPPHGEH